MRSVLLILCLLGKMCLLQAQEKITQYFPAGKANAGILIEGYVSPIAEDLGALINNGWTTTASTHEKFGFDISVATNSIFIKTENTYFTPGGLTNLVFDGNTSGTRDQVPTIYGSEGERPIFHFNSGPENNKIMEGPDGFDPSKKYRLDAQILPSVQAGIGLFKNTDVRLRYIPSYKIDNLKVGGWGIGVMHDIKQHIPGIRALPFALSVFIGYSHLDGDVDLSGLYTGNGQKGLVNTNGFNGQIFISKNISFITFYGSVGYNQSNSSFDIKGTYNVDKAYNSSGTISLAQPFTLTDPYSYTFKKSGVRATGGIRFKIGPIMLNGDYTLFNGRGLATAGLGLTFR